MPHKRVRSSLVVVGVKANSGTYKTVKGWDSADGGWRLAAVTYFSGGRIS